MLFGLFLVYKNVFYNLLIIIFLFQADADGKRQLFLLLQTTEKLLFNPYKYPKICPFKTQKHAFEKVKIGWKKSNSKCINKISQFERQNNNFSNLNMHIARNFESIRHEKNIQGFL